MNPHYNWIAVLGGLIVSSVSCSGTSPSVTQVQQTTTPSVSVNGAQAADIIRIVGASTPYPAMDLLGQAYTATLQKTQVTFLASSQSCGGIAGVKEGLAEIGTVTRRPKPEETDDNLVHREIAKDALLVATHPSVTNIDNLTTTDLQDIYSGQVTNWRAFGGPNAEIIVLDRAEDTSAKRLLRRHYLGATLQNSSQSILLRRESDIVEALQNTPYSIGTLSLSQVNTKKLPITPIKLNGIAPTAENLQSDQYPMHRTLGIVWYGTPTTQTQHFIDFIFSANGANVLEQAGFVPSFTTGDASL